MAEDIQGMSPSPQQDPQPDGSQPVGMQAEEPTPNPVPPLSPTTPAQGEGEEEIFEEDEHNETHDAEMAAMLESSFEVPEQGSIVQGTIISITQDDVMVATGGKSEAVIPRREFDGDERIQPLEVGQTYNLVFRGTKGGSPVLSRTEARRQAAEVLVQEAYEKQTPVMTHILRRTKGGLKVDVMGLPGFMPFSHSGVKRGQEKEIEALVGQTLQTLIAEPPGGKDLVVSRRLWLDKESVDRKKMVLENLQVGQAITGKVKHLTTFGAFIDLGGIDGLLHVKDMSWSHVAKPQDMFNIGDEVHSVVSSIEGEKIGLSLKSLKPDPWLTIKETMPVGSIQEGRVSSLASYGAFVKFSNDVEGLIHISEMHWTKHLRHPEELFKVGDLVRVKILSIDENKRKIGLGYKQTMDDPFEKACKEHPQGSLVRGKVISFTDYAAFVMLPEGIEGMLHVSDMVWGKKVRNPREILKEGDEVEVKILNYDLEKRKISLGLKQISQPPWETFRQTHKEGDIVEGPVVSLTDFGAFVRITEHLDGLIHVSEITSDKKLKPADKLKVNQVVKAVIIKIDDNEQRIGLSLRKIEEQAHAPEREKVIVPKEEEDTLSDFGHALNSAREKFEKKGNPN